MSNNEADLNRDAEIKFCRICGEELKEDNRSKDKPDLCFHCESMDISEEEGSKNVNDEDDKIAE